ncbi:MAG: hypothetical protein ACFB8W_15305 [Elainellaceae cyanobacterium]
MNKNPSKSSSLISVQTVIAAAIAWGFISLLIFLLGSPITPRPQWYGITTYVLENTAMLAAALLCFRNWKSPQIVSGRLVWLLFGLGISSYFLGNILLGWWELVWGLSPDVSPADLFYLLTYLLLGTGMLLAVISKRLNLTPLQWLIVAGIAVFGTLLAYFISYAGGEEVAATPNSYRASSPAAVVLVSDPPVSHNSGALGAIAPISHPPQGGMPVRYQPLESVVASYSSEFWLATAPPADPAAGTAPATEPVSPEAVPATPEIEAATEPVGEASNAPQWVVALDNSLAPLAGPVGLLYVVGDIFLLVMATTLLLAFWGGRFSQSWRFIAAAAFSFYIADMWFAYAIERIENYETGALPEVFWIFSGVLFGVGAVLEYDLSTRSRRGARRRGA